MNIQDQYQGYADWLSIETRATNSNEFVIKIQNFSLLIGLFKMLPAKYLPSSSDLTVLTHHDLVRPYGVIVWVNFVPDNGVLPYSTKPLA